MRLSYIFTALVLGLNTTYALAQSEIYKCTQPDGNVLYLNDRTQMKGLNCDKTDLAKLDKLTILNKPVAIVKNTSSNSTMTNVGNSIESAEQKVRDEKRALILRQELSQEQNQLKTVAEMLKNVEKSSDAAQIEQLKKMQDNHMRNIASLQKELGVKSDVELVVNPQMLANISKSSLPTAMPVEVSKQNTSSIVSNNVNTSSMNIKKESAPVATKPVYVNTNSSLVSKKSTLHKDKPSPIITYSGENMTPSDFLSSR